MIYDHTDNDYTDMDHKTYQHQGRTADQEKGISYINAITIAAIALILLYFAFNF